MERKSHDVSWQRSASVAAFEQDYRMHRGGTVGFIPGPTIPSSPAHDLTRIKAEDRLPETAQAHAYTHHDQGSTKINVTRNINHDTPAIGQDQAYDGRDIESTLHSISVLPVPFEHPGMREFLRILASQQVTARVSSTPGRDRDLVMEYSGRLEGKGMNASRLEGFRAALRREIEDVLISMLRANVRQNTGKPSLARELEQNFLTRGNECRSMDLAGIEGLESPAASRSNDSTYSSSPPAHSQYALRLSSEAKLRRDQEGSQNSTECTHQEQPISAVKLLGEHQTCAVDTAQMVTHALERIVEAGSGLRIEILQTYFKHTITMLEFHLKHAWAYENRTCLAEADLEPFQKQVRAIWIGMNTDEKQLWKNLRRRLKKSKKETCLLFSSGYPLVKEQGLLARLDQVVDSTSEQQSWPLAKGKYKHATLTGNEPEIHETGTRTSGEDGTRSSASIPSNGHIAHEVSAGNDSSNEGSQSADNSAIITDSPPKVSNRPGVQAKKRSRSTSDYCPSHASDFEAPSEKLLTRSPARPTRTSTHVAEEAHKRRRAMGYLAPPELHCHLQVEEGSPTFSRFRSGGAKKSRQKNKNRAHNRERQRRIPGETERLAVYPVTNTSRDRCLEQNRQSQALQTAHQGNGPQSSSVSGLRRGRSVQDGARRVSRHDARRAQTHSPEGTIVVSQVNRSQPCPGISSHRTKAQAERAFARRIELNIQSNADAHSSEAGATRPDAGCPSDRTKSFCSPRSSRVDPSWPSRIRPVAVSQSSKHTSLLRSSERRVTWVRLPDPISPGPIRHFYVVNEPDSDVHYHCEDQPSTEELRGIAGKAYPHDQGQDVPELRMINDHVIAAVFYRARWPPFKPIQLQGFLIRPEREPRQPPRGFVWDCSRANVQRDEVRSRLEMAFQDGGFQRPWPTVHHQVLGRQSQYVVIFAPLATPRLLRFHVPFQTSSGNCVARFSPVYWFSRCRLCRGMAHPTVYCQPNETEILLPSREHRVWRP